MLYLKSYKRCGGDMYTDRDYYGRFLDCLQCGYIIENGTQKYYDFMNAFAVKQKKMTSLPPKPYAKV